MTEQLAQCCNSTLAAFGSYSVLYKLTFISIIIIIMNSKFTSPQK